MRFNRDYFIPSFTTIVIGGMIAFLSCSHQFRNVSNEEDNESDNLGETLVEESTESPLQDRVQNDAPAAQQQSESMVENNDVSQNSGNVLAMDSSEYGSPSGADASQSSPPPTQSGPRTSINSKPRFKLPTIPQKAFKAKVSLLNRFYFVRQGDTPSKASELIYGSTSNENRLKSWNRGRWSPGRVIFYTSPKNPTDIKMRSLYFEQQIGGEQYTIKRGDWLSKIAHRQLGNYRSWTEIAIMNNIKSLEDVRVGKKILILPVDLTQNSLVATANTPTSTQPTLPIAPQVQPPVSPAQEQVRAPLNITPEPSKASPERIRPKSYFQTIIERITRYFSKSEQ